MLTLKDFESQVLVEYKRNSHKEPVGVVVAIGRHALGWSLCNAWDVFNKQQGLSMALGRAITAADLGPEASKEYYEEKLPQSLRKLKDKVHGRAKLYFKETSILPEDDDLPF
jgi:hypothetical protein